MISSADLMTRSHERCPYWIATRGNIEVTLMIDGMPLVPADTTAGYECPAERMNARCVRIIAFRPS
jgi:hypothetical protein